MNLSISEYRALLVKQFKSNKFKRAPKIDRKWEGVFRGRVQTIEFDSKGEMNRFCFLLMLQKNNVISDLQIKEKFYFKTGTKSRFYECDFSYYDVKLKRWVVEDFKGVQTQVFKIKWDVITALYPTLLFKIVTIYDEFN